MVLCHYFVCVTFCILLALLWPVVLFPFVLFLLQAEHRAVDECAVSIIFRSHEAGIGGGLTCAAEDTPSRS